MIAIPYIVDNIHHIEKMLSDSLDIKGTVPIRLHSCKFSKKKSKKRKLSGFLLTIILNMGTSGGMDKETQDILQEHSFLTLNNKFCENTFYHMIGYRVPL